MEEVGGPDARAGALAHHFTEALPLGTAAKAIEYTTKAGYEAVADFALEDAVAYFELALHLLKEYAPTDWTQRVELLIDLAAALVNVDDTEGVHAALRAVDAAAREWVTGTVRTSRRRVRRAESRGLVVPESGRHAARRGAAGAR